MHQHTVLRRAAGIDQYWIDWNNIIEITPTQRHRTPKSPTRSINIHHVSCYAQSWNKIVKAIKHEAFQSKSAKSMKIAQWSWAKYIGDASTGEAAAQPKWRPIWHIYIKALTINRASCGNGEWAIVNRFQWSLIPVTIHSGRLLT